MIQDVGRDLCYGCTACFAVCPVQALSMEENEEGFKYPQPDGTKCISCGLCRKVCPALSRELTGNATVKEAYAAKHISAEVLGKSASGGMFTAISDYILNQGGTVYGAAFDANMVVRHMRADSCDIRNKMRDSKYVQSDMGNIFSKVKQDLDNGIRVLFTGTPCQVDGLKRFLQKDYENLICVDLICNSVPSPGLFRAHLDYIEKKNHRKVAKYFFRPKRWTWKIHREIAVLDNNKECHSMAYTELWRNIYYLKLATRPSCHNCRYTNLERVGDITIADCRGIEKTSVDFEYMDGVSLVLINTSRGAKVFDEISKEVLKQKISVEDVLQPTLKRPGLPNERRAEFWNNYFKGGYKKAVHSYFGNLYELKYYIKKLLHK